MDKILCVLKGIYKKIRPPKRLYKYGTIGLSVCDDRTLKEKFFDKIDDFFFNWEQKQRYKRAKISYVFRSYFDFGLGKVVSSTEEIKKKEKEGYVYMSDSELDRESARRKRLNKQANKERAIKYFEEGFAKIKSGNSNYYQQYLKRIQK